MELNSVSMELQNAYFNSIKELKEGEIIRGKVVGFNSKEVIVDVGYKSEGVIPSEEFVGLDLNEINELDVYVENVEDEEGKIILSFKKARETQGWSTLANNYNEGDLVEGTIVRKVKGGYIVNIFGVEGFLPQSLSVFRSVRDEDTINKKFLFNIVKLSKAKGNFIVSRKEAIRREKEKARQKVWEDLEIGTVLQGRVKSVANFGAFVDLGGVDGLLHIADMSWKKISHPSEIVAVGDQIQVMVLNYEKDKGKISLGLKQTTPDPWKEIDKKLTVGSVVQGRITNIQNYGIFVELEKGIEGLVHISEISWVKRFINLQEQFAIGDAVEAKIIGLEPEDRKISLSVKQLEVDPWEDIDNLINVDEVTQGKVSGFSEGCAYVELANGLEGVIYNEDISWTKRVNRAQEVFKRGASLDCKVLGVDRTNRKVILGLKQLKDDPWPQILEKYPVGLVLEGQVVKVADFGVFVKIDDELEGLVFSGEIEKEVIERLNPQDPIQVKIIKVDPGAAKIGLSAKIDEERTYASS